MPYERPPLSKEYFSGDKTAERLRIRPPAFWEEREISLILNTRIEAIDPVSHRVTTRDCHQLTYGRLVWAAGGSPKRLPLPEGLDGNVLTIRNLADADRLKAMAASASRILVIGGGEIGLPYAFSEQG